MIQSRATQDGFAAGHERDPDQPAAARQGSTPPRRPATRDIKMTEIIDTVPGRARSSYELEDKTYREPTDIFPKLNTTEVWRFINTHRRHTPDAPAPRAISGARLCRTSTSPAIWDTGTLTFLGKPAAA